MPVTGDFEIIRYEDGVLNVSLTPPTAIGGWDLEFRLQRRFGAQAAPLALYSCASGFNGTSGMQITDSGQGRMSVNFWGAPTSGLDPGNYAYAVSRTTSGFRTTLADGYVLLGTTVGQ